MLRAPSSKSFIVFQYFNCCFSSHQFVYCSPINKCFLDYSLQIGGFLNMINFDIFPGNLFNFTRRYLTLSLLGYLKTSIQLCLMSYYNKFCIIGNLLCSNFKICKQICTFVKIDQIKWLT